MYLSDCYFSRAAGPEFVIPDNEEEIKTYSLFDDYDGESLEVRGIELPIPEKVRLQTRQCC